MFCLIAGEAVSKPETIAGLNIFCLDPFSFEFINNPEQELARRISSLFRISSRDPIT